MFVYKRGGGNEEEEEGEVEKVREVEDKAENVVV